MYRLTALLIALSLFILPAGWTAASAAQNSGQITDLGIDFQFGEAITFRAQLPAELAVTEVQVYISPEGQPVTTQPMSISNGKAEAQVDPHSLTLTPFAHVGYRFEAALASGGKLQSADFSFQYSDNRFSWQMIEAGNLQISWNGNDAALGQEIVNIAQEGLKKARNYLAAEPPERIRIYAYSSSKDLRAALQLTDQPWIAGHAAPALGIVMISVPSGPEQKLELERQIPHEIMHLIQYQVMGENFEQQPVWLVEGMASLAELYPNPEYSRVLEATAAEGDLLPIASLCDTFPREAGAAFRAYAQSESFVRYLYEQHGSTGLRGMIEQYRDGLGCEQGISAALGASLSQIERRWQQETLGIDAEMLALEKLSPYLALGLLILLPAAATLLPHTKKKIENTEKAG